MIIDTSVREGNWNQTYRNRISQHFAYCIITPIKGSGTGRSEPKGVYYHICEINFAAIAHPLTELLRHNPVSKHLEWTEVAKTSFNNLKQALLSCPTLAYPTTDTTKYQLVADSSSLAVGAALYQMVDSRPTPLGFFSKKLSDVQKTYSTYDRELLAAYLAVLHFKSLIDGHDVTLFLDHKPIVSAF